MPPEKAPDEQQGQAPSRGVTVADPTATVRIQGHAPTLIIAGVDPATGDRRIEVNSPHVRSDARQATDGTVSLHAEGTPDVGDRGEARVMKTLRATLRERGVDAAVVPGDDSRGEDRLLRLPDRTLVVQVVTAPLDEQFWSAVAQGSATARADPSQATGFLRAAITRKAEVRAVADRRETLLAIDALHAGVLATPLVINDYLLRFGSPAVEFEFSSVWVVGPTVPYCVRLGDGMP